MSDCPLKVLCLDTKIAIKSFDIRHLQFIIGWHHRIIVNNLGLERRAKSFRIICKRSLGLLLWLHRIRLFLCVQSRLSLSKRGFRWVLIVIGFRLYSWGRFIFLIFKRNLLLDFFYLFWLLHLIISLKVLSLLADRLSLVLMTMRHVIFLFFWLWVRDNGRGRYTRRISDLSLGFILILLCCLILSSSLCLLVFSPTLLIGAFAVFSFESCHLLI